MSRRSRASLICLCSHSLSSGDGIELWPKFIFCGPKTRKVTLSKWLPAFVLGPILPACYCVMVVVFGQIILSANLCKISAPGFPVINPAVCEDEDRAFGEKCDDVADALYSVIFGAYLFLCAFSWVFFGFTASFDLGVSKKTGKRRVLTPFSPFTTLLALLKCYAPIYLFNLVGCVMLAAQWAAAQNSCEAVSLMAFSLLVWVCFIIGTFIMLTYLFFIFFSKKAALLAAKGMQRLKEGNPKSDMDIAEQKFNRYDKDKSGTILPIELRLLLDDLKIPMEEADVAKLEKEIGGDGVIAKDEFLAWYKKDKEEREQLQDDEAEGDDDAGGDDDAEKEDG